MHAPPEISRALAPLRELVAALGAARLGVLPDNNQRRRLVRRLRAAGPTAIPALLRSLASRRICEAELAGHLVTCASLEVRQRLRVRLAGMARDPRLPESNRGRIAGIIDGSWRSRVPAATRPGGLAPPRRSPPNLRAVGDQELAPARELLSGPLGAVPPDASHDEVARGEELFQHAFDDLSAGRLTEARAGFLQVLEFLPGHYPSWGNLGAVAIALGELDEAERCLRRALELNPDYGPARQNLDLLSTSTR